MPYYSLPLTAAIGLTLGCIMSEGCNGHHEPGITGPQLASPGDEKLQAATLNAQKLYNEGLTSYLKGDYETAVIKYRKSNSLSYSSLVRLEIVNCLDALGKVQEADSELEALMTKRNSMGSYQTDAKVLLRYGQALERGKRFKEAEKQYRAIILTYKPSAAGNLPPLSVERANSISDLKAYGNVIAALQSYRHGDLKNALKFAKQATEISPQLDDAHLRYADLLDGLERNADAIREYKLCRESKSKDIAKLAKDRIEHIQIAMKKGSAK